MSSPEERPEGTIRVYFTDNTYSTLRLNSDTPVSEVIERLCRRSSQGGRHIDPNHQELLIIAPGSQALRERRLMREDRPLQIQTKGGSQAFKFLFREVHFERPAVAASGCSTSSGSRHAGTDAATAITTGAAALAGAGSARQQVAVGQKSHTSAEDAGTAEFDFVPVADINGALRTGSLERYLAEVASSDSPGNAAETGNGAAVGPSWHKCTVVLMEDRLWYSQGPAGNGGVGGGMASLALCDCDKVVECDDKRQLRLVMNGGATMTFRARNHAERGQWLLAIAKQAAYVKERGILEEAERIITSIEFKRSTRQLARLEAFASVSGILASARARELLLDFARSAYEGLPSGSASGSDEGERAQRTCASSSWWPIGLDVENLAACLERWVADGGLVAATGAGDDVVDRNCEDLAIRAFVGNVLFPKFQEHPGAQVQLCRIAAGVA